MVHLLQLRNFKSTQPLTEGFPVMTRIQENKVFKFMVLSAIVLDLNLALCGDFTEDTKIKPALCEKKSSVNNKDGKQAYLIHVKYPMLFCISSKLRRNH